MRALAAAPRIIRLALLPLGGTAERPVHTEFKYGLGPCGRRVVALAVEIDAGGVTIFQTCEDNQGNPDIFFYPMARVLGVKIYNTSTPEVACPL